MGKLRGKWRGNGEIDEEMQKKMKEIKEKNRKLRVK